MSQRSATRRRALAVQWGLHAPLAPAPARDLEGLTDVHGGWLVIGSGLASALAFAVATSLKHLTAGQAPDAQGLRLRQLLVFVRATLTHPLWLVGIGCDLIGVALQLVALHLGSLSVVQPLLISGLVFALVLRPRLEQQQVTGRQLRWAVVLSGALAGFLLLTGSGRAAAGEQVDRIPALVAGLIGAAAIVGCVLLGRRRRDSTQAAAILGVAVGIIYAATAALLKTVTDIAVRHKVGVLASWQLYLLIVLGVGGLLLNQLAFQAGPITASLPATATLDPLLSIVIGVLIYDEPIHRGPGGGTLLIMSLLVLTVAVVELTRSAATTGGGENAAASP